MLEARDRIADDSKDRGRVRKKGEARMDLVVVFAQEGLFHLERRRSRIRTLKSKTFSWWWRFKVGMEGIARFIDLGGCTNPLRNRDRLIGCNSDTAYVARSNASRCDRIQAPGARAWNSVAFEFR